MSSVLFTLLRAYPSSDYREPERRRGVSAEEVLRELLESDWALEARQAAWSKQNYPGISVTQNDSGTTFWMQCCNTLDESRLGRPLPNDWGLHFTVGVRDPSDAPDVWRVDSGRMMQDCQFETVHFEDLEKLLSLFLQGHVDEFYAMLFSLEQATILFE